MQKDYSSQAVIRLEAKEGAIINASGTTTYSNYCSIHHMHMILEQKVLNTLMQEPLTVKGGGISDI